MKALPFKVGDLVFLKGPTYVSLNRKGMLGPQKQIQNKVGLIIAMRFLRSDAKFWFLIEGQVCSIYAYHGWFEKNLVLI